MRRWMRWPALLGSGFLALSTLAGAIRPDEFDCEEAVAHIANCCPGFPTSAMRCEYLPGCDGEATYPDLTVDQSQRILGADCAAIQAHGFCDPNNLVPR